MIGCKRKIVSICNNINKYGLYRYDPRDIDDIVERINNNKAREFANKFLQVLEAICPYTVRKLLGCKPRIYPTTFTFIAESQYNADDGLPLMPATFFMDQCIKEYYRGHGFWKYKENKSFFPDLTNTNKPSMPLYMLARCNNILARIGINKNISEYISISKKSLEYLFSHHSIFKHNDGTENISYYYNSYNSIDNTINVNTEVLDWMSQIPRLLTPNKGYLSHFRLILNGVLNEQNEDGSFFYFSHEHMRKNRIGGTIDCHHTATVIYNLIHVYNSLIINNNTNCDIDRLYKCIKKAMSYFVSHFFSTDGSGITIIGKSRKASSVQYGESLVALIDYIRFIDNTYEYRQLINKIANILITLVDTDGSAPGDSKIKPININNINWGNGPVLYALTHYVYQYEQQ